MSQDPSDSKYITLTHFSISLAQKYVNLKEPYNQDIKESVTTIIFLKKNTDFTWNLQPHKQSMQKVLFKLNPQTNWILKTLNLVINLSLISNKAPNLFSAICSEINAVSNTNLILLQNIRSSYVFGFSLETVTINWKKILQLIITAYIWSFSIKSKESIKSHS